jgi:hypothetical protein
LSVDCGIQRSFLLLCLLLPRSLFSGDAVVVGYNADGVWTAVTYYCSSTPKGGKDYKDKIRAHEAALRDLKRRSGLSMVRSEVLSESDLTGYVAVARGKTEAETDVTAVGRGESQAIADRDALTQLNQGGAKGAQKIVYRYFSYGAHPGAKRYHY